MKDKQTLRKEYKALRDNFDKKKLHEESLKILDFLYKTEAYQKSDTVFTYVNMNSEVETIPLIKQALKDKKTVAVCALTLKKHEMIFIKINDLNNLKTNKFGTLEPEIKKENILTSSEKTLLIVPGLVFDKRGYRIGYGGGYYDFFISNNKKTLANIGICLDFQLINENLPIEEFDEPLNMIITNGGILTL